MKKAHIILGLNGVLEGAHIDWANGVSVQMAGVCNSSGLIYVGVMEGVGASGIAELEVVGV